MLRPFLLIGALALGGCATPPASVDLTGCPGGDAAWYDALRTAEAAGPGAVTALGASVEPLVAACDGAWQPDWLAGRCTMAGENPSDPSERFVRCLGLARSADDAVGIARCGDDLAWVHFVLGDYASSEPQFDEALAAAARAGRRDLESYIQGNRAALYGQLGRFAESGEALDRAEAGFVELGMHEEAIDVAYNRSVVALELGDAVGAQEVLRRLHAESSDPRDIAEIEISLGNVQLALGEPAAAIEWFERVDRADVELAGLADMGIARAALRLDDLPRAEAVLRDGLARLDQRFPVRALRLECWLAELERRRGEHDAARRRLDSVIERADASEEAQVSSIARWLRGRAELDAGRLDAAIADLDGAIARLESMRAGLDPLDDGLRFLRERSDPYVDLLVALSRAKQSDGDRVLAALAGAQSHALRRSVPGWAEQLPSSMRGLRGSLAPGELLLSYLIGEQRGVVLAVRAEGHRLLPIAGRRTLAPAVAAYRSALQGADPPDDAGRALGELLLGPVDDWLRDASRLHVIADRDLALVPFSSLPSGEGLLVERAEVAVLPMTAAAERLSESRGPLLLGGQPTRPADSPFAELPWAAFELSTLSALWSHAEVTLLTRAAFTREALVGGDLARFRTIHLATHAVASTRDPRRCGVILSGDERLGLDAIARLELDAALIVLSACRTGEGELVAGEGVIGLGWAFLRAGAAAIVVSHWTVDDNSTARLMVAFHQQLAAGVDPVRALALAKRERIAAGAPRSHWAPFEIVVRPQLMPES